MDDGVVYISDDDEVEEETPTTVSAVTRPPFYTYNTYELYDNSSGEKLSLAQDDTDTGESVNDVVVVLDDEEVEALIIGPIQRISRQILFSTLELPAKFPYQHLIELEQHLNDNVKDILHDAEANVWVNTLEHLVCIKMAYAHLDVS